MSHTTESIKELLERNDAAVERALQVLYDRQTDDEKATESTSHNNGRGFNGIDAEILSSFACQVNRKVGFGKKLGTCLSEKQMTIARRKVSRYARQLVEEANAKEEAKKIVKSDTENIEDMLTGKYNTAAPTLPEAVTGDNPDYGLYAKERELSTKELADIKRRMQEWFNK